MADTGQLTGGQMHQSPTHTQTWEHLRVSTQLNQSYDCIYEPWARPIDASVEPPPFCSRTGLKYSEYVLAGGRRDFKHDGGS